MTPLIDLDQGVDGMAQSATLAIKERCERRAASGQRTFDFGLGQSPFPVPDVVVQALQAHAHEKAYLPVRGLPALRHAVASNLEAKLGVRFDPQDLIVGPGSKELLFLLQVVHAGELWIPTPGWVSYEPQARILGRRPVLLPGARADDYLPDPAVLDDLLTRAEARSRVLLLNYPNNPTGCTIDQARLRALAEVARKHRLVVVSDEIYGALQFEGGHRSIAAEYPEGTIVSTGLSKWCGAGGWRLGVMAFPPALRRVRDAMVAVASETFTSTSSPIQHAAVRAFEGGPALDEYLGACRGVLGLLARWAARELVAMGLHVPPPAGGFYVYPDFELHAASLRRRGITTSTALAEALLDQTGIAALPGSCFGRPASELTLRFSLVHFDGARALASAKETPLDQRFIERCCPAIRDALGALAHWTSVLA